MFINRCNRRYMVKHIIGYCLLNDAPLLLSCLTKKADYKGGYLIGHIFFNRDVFTENKKHVLNIKSRR